MGPPLWRTEFKPVPLAEGPGRFFNQCIQKKGKTITNIVSSNSLRIKEDNNRNLFDTFIKFHPQGLTDFTDGMLVAVIGGCEGSAVLAVVELNTKVMSV